MKVELLSDIPKQLNELDKNCLTNTMNPDYIDEDNSERLFSIYDNANGTPHKVATIDACLANEKAGLQIARMRSDKDFEKQKEIIKEFINFVFDVSNMNQLVLAVYVIVDGCGIDIRVLEKLGFVGGITGRGSGYYGLLNPAYMELVETFATDEAATERLTEVYDVHQLTMEKTKKQLEQARQNSIICLDDCVDESQRGYFKNDIDHFTESIEAINSLMVQEQKSNRL